MLIHAQVNVLSKMDLVEQYGELAFGLDFYLQVICTLQDICGWLWPCGAGWQLAWGQAAALLQFTCACLCSSQPKT